VDSFTEQLKRSGADGTCRRDGDVESLKLVDPFGRNWQVSFPGKDVSVSMNGTELATFPVRKTYEIGSFIENEIDQLVKGRGRSV
jgi:hypothetical protein